MDVAWNVIHARMQYSPLYRHRYGENAFETWLTCHRPWSRNLREYPFLDCLFDLEVIAFQMAVEWYYNHTPTSQGSETPRPPILAEHETHVEGRRIEGIFQRLVTTGVDKHDAQCGTTTACKQV